MHWIIREHNKNKHIQCQRIELIFYTIEWWMNRQQLSISHGNILPFATIEVK